MPITTLAVAPQSENFRLGLSPNDDLQASEASNDAPAASSPGMQAAVTPLQGPSQGYLTVAGASAVAAGGLAFGLTQASQGLFGRGNSFVTEALILASAKFSADLSTHPSILKLKPDLITASFYACVAASLGVFATATTASAASLLLTLDATPANLTVIIVDQALQRDASVSSRLTLSARDRSILRAAGGISLIYAALRAMQAADPSGCLAWQYTAHPDVSAQSAISLGQRAVEAGFHMVPLATFGVVVGGALTRLESRTSSVAAHQHGIVAPIIGSVRGVYAALPVALLFVMLRIWSSSDRVCAAAA